MFLGVSDLEKKNWEKALLYVVFFFILIIGSVWQKMLKDF